MKNKRMSAERPPTNKRIQKNDLKKEEVKTRMIRVDDNDHEWIKNKAFEERLSMKEMVTILIEEYKK